MLRDVHVCRFCGVEAERLIHYSFTEAAREQQAFAEELAALDDGRVIDLTRKRWPQVSVDEYEHLVTF